MLVPTIKPRATTPLVPGRIAPKCFKTPPKSILLPIKKINATNEKFTAYKSKRALHFTKKAFKVKSNSPKPRLYAIGPITHLKSQPLKKNINKETYVPWVIKLQDSYELNPNKIDQDSEKEFNQTENLLNHYITKKNQHLIYYNNL